MPFYGDEDFEAYCDECSEGTDDPYWCEACDESFCQTCWYNLDSDDYRCGRCGGSSCEDEDMPRGVHGYNYTPDYRPKGDPAHTMMGVSWRSGTTTVATWSMLCKTSTPARRTST